MSETKVREEICRLGRSLFERGLTPGSSGNISVKLDDGGWLVTPTNASLGFLDPARLSRLGADGKLVSGDAPTKEVPLHTALYQTRNAARAVVHLHSTHSVALSMLPEIDPRAALPPMTAYYLMKCGATALVPYYRPGDPAVADAIKGLAGKYSSVLLANHGPVVSGDTLEAAVFAIEELEETAKLYLLLRGLNPRYLDAGAGRGFLEDVRADAAGAFAAHADLILRSIAKAMRLEGMKSTFQDALFTMRVILPSPRSGGEGARHQPLSREARLERAGRCVPSFERMLRMRLG